MRVGRGLNQRIKGLVNWLGALRNRAPPENLYSRSSMCDTSGSSPQGEISSAPRLSAGTSERYALWV